MRSSAVKGRLNKESSRADSMLSERVNALCRFRLAAEELLRSQRALVTAYVHTLPYNRSCAYVVAKISYVNHSIVCVSA